MYDLIIIWADGERESYAFRSREEAEQAEHNYLLAFGHQVEYVTITERR